MKLYDQLNAFTYKQLANYCDIYDVQPIGISKVYLISALVRDCYKLGFTTFNQLVDDIEEFCATW